MLPTTLIQKLKRDQHQQPARYEASLAARGSLRPYGSSQVELHALVAFIEPVCVILVVAALRVWSDEDGDFKGELLYADLSRSNRLVVEFPGQEGVKAASRQ